jgi:hypothetical protein
MAKQKAVSKTMSILQATKLYERLFVDASGPHPNSIGGNTYWFQAVKKKNAMLDFVREIFEEALASGHCVEYLRVDNAGENTVPLRALCKEP